MKIRAALFDIYKTLLDVGPPPDDAAARWESSCRRTVLAGGAPPTLVGFAQAAETRILRHHAAARASGIQFPEVFWPDVAREAWPALSNLDACALDDFLFAHAQLQRTVKLASGAAEVLCELRQRGVLLGLVSNSQPYTLRELDTVLSAAGLGREMFMADLQFLSFEHGFSKPDPHVFRILAARLTCRGIAPDEALVVGDRDDNDMRPALAHGFQTWRLAADAVEPLAHRGGWPQLRAALTALP